MMRSKVLPTVTSDFRGPSELLLGAHATVSSRPRVNSIPDWTPQSFSREFLLQHWSQILNWTVERYARLSWATRQTVSVAVSLSAVLYLFVTVPFRIGFYYDPKLTKDRWSEELTIFAVTDGLVDLVGLVQFVSLWKSSVVKVLSSDKIEVGKSRLDDTDEPSHVNLLVHSKSFRAHQRGKTNWTIATITALSTTGTVAQKMLSQQKFVAARTVEFVLEVVAVVPLEVISYALGRFNALHLVRVTKLCRLYRLRRCLHRVAKIYANRAWVQHLRSTGVDSLARNIGICAGLCHWVACGYMLIAHVHCGVSLEACDEHVETSWVVRDHLFGASVPRKYGRTVYWSTRTLVLLGYDDVTPVSNAETLYAVVVTFMGALFGSSLLANFLFLFRFRNARYAAYSTHVDNAREYMRLQNIPRPLRHQVIAYFNYSWRTHRSLNSEEALLLMPKHLQAKVVATLKASRIKQVCFLAKESVEFINLLALAMCRRVYSPGDRVTEPKTNAEMFFVIRGKVMLCGLDGSNLKECTAGDFFADICLLFPEQYEQKAVAKIFCELYVLAKAKFDEAFTEFYRGNENGVRAHMAETLEKYLMQLVKMKKMLGLRGAHEAGSRKSSIGGSSRSLITEDINSRKAQRGISWRFPDSSFSAHWDTARLLGVVYVAFEVPYFTVFISMSDGKRMFTVEPELGLRYVLTLLVEFFFAIDLILRSRYFAYLDTDMMLNIVQPNLIFSNYKANGLYADLIAWLPVGLVLDSLPPNAIQGHLSLFRLLRLLRIRLAPNLLQDIFEFYGKSSKLRLVVSLVLAVTFMLHVVGCLWFQMTLDGQLNLGDIAVMKELTRPECLRQATQFQNCSWVKFDCYAHVGTVFPLDDSESTYVASFAYLRSVYWAVVTLTGVGYGDIVAYSTAESYFAAIWIFVGSVINFGVVGAMSSTISNVLATHHHHMEKINTLNAVLQRMDISEKLSAEIRRFYHLQFTGRKQAYESQLLSNLPNQLCYQISALLHSEAVTSVTLFNSASIAFLKEVTGKFRHKNYQNGETICLEGDICREFFVFLHDSRVNMFFRSRKVPTRALFNGDCYGVNGFLLRRPYPATLSAASVVHASVMSREQFDEIQHKFANDVNDMKQEAESLWDEENGLLMRIVTNLNKLKLQSHMMQTPSLFYQRETAIIPSNQKQTLRDLVSLREIFTSSWSSLISCWNVYNALFVIFRICFHSHLHFVKRVARAVWVADLSCDACFVMDMYLRLYYFGSSDVGIENLMKRQKVDKRYLHSSRFKWDLLASLPIYGPYSSGSLIACLCRLPRLIRCVDLGIYLDNAIVQIQQHFASHNISSYLSPAKLMIILVLVAHYVGCIFLLISEHECTHTEHCWMDHDHLLHEYHHSVPMLYAKSFYWAITTLLLVGSRDIVPRDTAGTIWTGFTCLCCTFIIGHIVGEISELILELGKETKQYKSRIAMFESFAKEHDLPASLRERVTFFFRVKFEDTKGLNMGSTVHDLSANLRLKLLLEVYGHSVANLLICRFLTPSQINNLTLRLKSEFFITGDNILVEGTFGNRLCILRKGLAAAYWTKSVASVAVLMEGACFGEIAFFLPNQQRLATVRATTFCEVLYVSKPDWQELWVTCGNESDSQVQKHALYAILGWVSSRLQRYQHSTFRIASRAHRIISAQTRSNSTNSTNESSNSTDTRTRTNMLASILRSKDTLGFTRSATPPNSSSKAEPRQLFVSPQVQLLEKKAEYVLAKTEAFAKKLNATIATVQTRRSSIVSSIQNTIRTSLSSHQSASRSRDVNLYGGLRHSSNADALTQIGGGRNNKTDDIRLLQFILDLNPVNKYIRENLGNQGVWLLEEECWARCRDLAEAQHTVTNLLSVLLPTETSFVARRSRMKATLGRKSIRGQRSWARSKSQRKWGAEVLDVATPNTIKKTPEAVRLSGTLKRSDTTLTSRHKRRYSVASLPSDLTSRPLVPASKTELVATLIRMARCNSLPATANDFYRTSQPSQLPRHSKKRGTGIDFEILLRCQRPQYATQLRWYHRYLQWRSSSEAAVTPVSILAVHPNQKGGHALSQTGDMSLPVFRSLGRSRVAAIGSKLQLPSQQTLFTTATDLNTKHFIRQIKDAGKAWDLAMLIVAVYHLIVTPLKVTFAPALIEVSVESLRSWSAFEIFLDTLCLVDVGYQVRCASTTYSSMDISTASSSTGSLRNAIANAELRGDILAMLPLELLLLANPVRLSMFYTSSTIESTSASWWTMRWLLRSNRMLLIRRIKPLSDQLFQYIIHDLKIPVSEALLYFLRGLAWYLSMGHLLACVWFITSYLGLNYYGASWLSTSGMLTFISAGVTTTEETRRVLSESTGTFLLESVSLSRKYLRSLLFSMECISTLFYGDIVSMNLLELVVETASTFWSIYIYGALVGAQAELLDACARREAFFEQNLNELQHYVEHNGVPKTLKQHIKAYYARLWRRSRGEDEFAAVSSISRVLYEDVVSTSLQRFAIQVKAFRLLDEQFLRGLLVCLKYVVCSEGEEVVMKGDVDRSMYFIAQGRILVKIDSSEVTRERGEHFGELTLLYGISRLDTCVALTVAELYRLDHEPYERLLIEFPEYRVRNKLAWTTLSTSDRVESLLRLQSQTPQLPHTTLASRPNIERVAGVETFNIEAYLSFSFVHKASMTMLARLQTLHPLEAKGLILKFREGARKHLLRCVILDEEENSQHSDSSGDVQLRTVGLPMPDIKLLRVLKKTRALRGEQH